MTDLLGYYYEIMPTTFGRGRIILTDGRSVERFWCYEHLADAAIALIEWRMGGYVNEPQGWVKAVDPLSGPARRRIAGHGVEREWRDGDYKAELKAKEGLTT